MAYMSKERKSALAPEIKKICKKYGVKATLGVHNHSTLCLRVKSSPMDFITNCNVIAKERAARENRSHFFQDATTNVDVNPYWYHEHFSGRPKEFLSEVIEAMNVGNHDNSDIQSDYFDVGWYISIKIGNWDKPYVYTK